MEGSKGEISKFIEWAHLGPEGAKQVGITDRLVEGRRVDKVEVGFLGRVGVGGFVVLSCSYCVWISMDKFGFCQRSCCKDYNTCSGAQSCLEIVVALAYNFRFRLLSPQVQWLERPDLDWRREFGEKFFNGGNKREETKF